MKKILINVGILFMLMFAFSSVANAADYLNADYHFVRIERGSTESVVVSSDDGIYYGNMDKWGVRTYVSEYGNDSWIFEFYAEDDADLGTNAINIETQDGELFEIIYVYVVDKQPTYLHTYSKSKSSITVAWDKTDVGRYELQYRVKGGSWKTATPWTSKTKYTLKGLKSGKSYQFRVRSVNYSNEWNETYGYWSNIKTVTTNK